MVHADRYVAVDASGIFSETKRKAGFLRMLQAGVIITDYASLMVEILKDNSRPDASAIYGAIDMPWAKLVGQIARRMVSRESGVVDASDRGLRFALPNGNGDA